MKKHILYAKSNGQKFIFEKPFDIKNLPAKVEKYGRLQWTVEKYVPLKTNKQLGYLHAGIYPFLAKELRKDVFFTKEDWHTFLKYKFGIKKTFEEFMKERDIDIPVDDFIDRLKTLYGMNEQELAEKLNLLLSHSKYTEKQMSDFISSVKEWVLHFFNVQIPPPIVIEEYI